MPLKPQSSIQRFGLDLASKISIANVEGPASKGTASGTKNGSPAGISPIIPFSVGNIIRREIKKSTIPPAMLTASSLRFNYSKRYWPTNKNINSTSKAKHNSRINIWRLRDSLSTVFKTERNKGTFPRGFMMRSKVRPVDSISMKIIVEYQRRRRELRLGSENKY